MANSSIEQLLTEVGGDLVPEAWKNTYSGKDKVRPGDEISTSEGVNLRNRRQLDLNNLLMDRLGSDTTFTRGERAARMNPIVADLETQHGQKRALEHTGLLGRGIGSGSGIAQKAASADELNSIMELADAYARGAMDEVQLTEQLQGAVLSSIQGAMDTDRQSSVAIQNYNNRLESEKKAQGSDLQNALGGAASGAAIGTSILPGIGTAVGAGLGGIFGWLGGRDKKKQLEAAKRSDQLLPHAGRAWRSEMEKRAAGADPTSDEALAELLRDGEQAIGAKGAQSVQSAEERALQSQRRPSRGAATSAALDSERTAVDAKRRLKNALKVQQSVMQPAQQSQAQQALQADLAGLRAAEAGVTPAVNMSPSWWNTLAQVGATAAGIYGQFKDGDKTPGNTANVDFSRYVGPNGAYTGSGAPGVYLNPAQVPGGGGFAQGMNFSGAVPTPILVP